MFEPEELMARIVDLEEQLKESEMAPPAAEQLIACLEGEIAKRDARIAELEGALSWHEEQRNDTAELRAELAAIKAQEPVARLPACPSRAFAVANLRDLAQSVLQHDPDVGIFRDEDQAYLINELADLTEAFNGDVKLYAAPVSEAKAQGVEIDADDLAQFIREIDGNHKMGAGVLAEHIAARLNAPSPAGVDGFSASAMPDEVFADEFAAWWEEDGKYVRAGGGQYEKSFAFQAWRYLMPRVASNQAIIDGLRGEVERFTGLWELELARAQKAENEAAHCALTIDQQARRIGELASHLEFAVTMLTVAGLAGNAQVEAMRSALSAGHEPQ